MNKIKVGNRLLCIFDKPLPGNEYGPQVLAGATYNCIDIFTDENGNQHIDVGLPFNGCNFVTAYGTEGKLILPGKTHWCHPNRFIVINK